MARNDEIPESTDFTKAVSAGIRRLMEQHDTTHEILAAAINRSQSYVSLRARGMRPWTTDDLDAVAHYRHAGEAERARAMASIGQPLGLTDGSV